MYSCLLFLLESVVLVSYRGTSSITRQVSSWWACLVKIDKKNQWINRAQKDLFSAHTESYPIFQVSE